jgi:hypothetical protein
MGDCRRDAGFWHVLLYVGSPHFCERHLGEGPSLFQQMSAEFMTMVWWAFLERGSVKGSGGVRVLQCVCDVTVRMIGDANNVWSSRYKPLLLLVSLTILVAKLRCLFYMYCQVRL